MDSYEKILIDSIFQHIPQYIFWKNTDSVYLGCNKRYAHLLGLPSPQDIIGKTDYEIGWLPDGDTADQFRLGDQETLAGRYITNQEEWLSLPNGNKLLTLINKVPLVSETGQTLGVLGVATDITEKKRIEAHLAKTDHQLQGMTIISASIAHELRTPLAALKNAAEAIQKLLPLLIAAYETALKQQLSVSPISPRKRQLLPTVVDSLSRKVTECQRVVDMMLINSRYNRLHPFKMDRCSIRQCINKALAQYSFPKHHCPEIIWNNNSDFIFYGKAILVRHVLFNLLKNSIYFIQRAGKGCIEIWLEATSEENILHFKDSGQGIPSENITRIFDLFFTVGTNKGTGIGLAFCKMTMETLGGYISCRSRWQHFTEFLLHFPKPSTIMEEVYV